MTETTSTDWHTRWTELHDEVDSEARVCANFLLDYDATTHPGVKAKSLELAIASARSYAERKQELRAHLDAWLEATR